MFIITRIESMMMWDGNKLKRLSRSCKLIILIRAIRARCDGQMSFRQIDHRSMNNQLELNWTRQSRVKRWWLFKIPSDSKRRTRTHKEETDRERIVQQKTECGFETTCPVIFSSFLFTTIYVSSKIGNEKERKNEQTIAAYFYATCISCIFLNTQKLTKTKLHHKRTSWTRREIIMLFNLSSFSGVSAT